MTPERIAELRAETAKVGRQIVSICQYGDGGYDTDYLEDEWCEMLDEIERLRGLVEERHSLCDHHDENGYLVSWSCSCGKWRASGPDATKFYALPHLDEPQARAALAAHVASVLEGRAS